MRQFKDFHPPNYKPRIVFRTTSRCNYRCRICFWGRPEVAQELQKKDTTMPMDLFVQVLHEALPYCSELSFADGGEFMMDPLFEERMKVLVRALGDYPEIRFNQNTNASLLCKDRLASFRGMRKVGFMISIDSLDSLSYASIRRPGSLSVVLGNIEHLRSNLAEFGVLDLRLQLNMVILKRNIFSIPDMLLYAKKLGADLFVDHPQGFGPEDLVRESLFGFPAFSNSFLAQCQEFAKTLGIRFYRPPPFAISDGEISQCAYSDEFKNDHCLQLDNYGPISILANGDFSVCCMGLTFGNLNHYSFKEIFFSEKYKEYRDAIAVGSPLPPCNSCRWLHRYTSPYLFDSSAYQLDIPVESRNLEIGPDFVKEGFFDWLDELPEHQLRSELKHHYLSRLKQLSDHEIEDRIRALKAMEPFSARLSRRFHQRFASLEACLVRWARSRGFIMNNLWMQKLLITTWETLRKAVSGKR